MIKKINYKIICILIYFLSFHLTAQQFGKGILLTETTPENIQVSAKLMRGDFLNLPDNFSLKRFTPTPGNQGFYSTCAGWACSYSARTILNSIKNNYIQPLIDENAFSPSYVYNQIRKDSSCENPVFLHEALDIIKEQGVLQIKDFGYECERPIKSQEKYKAGINKILEYREIFNRYDINKTLATKKSISEFKPVVIAMDIPNSFEHCKEIWNPGPEDYREWHIGHAIVVIGYDDTLAGGSFEVINSWGKNWGNNGYCWIRYEDFEYFTYYGYEIIDELLNPGTDFNLSGSLSFKLENGKPLLLRKVGSLFQTINSYVSGTKFNVFLSNNQPAFVYAFGSDLKKKITKLFPPNERVSPLLPYKKNNIAIPNEYSNLMLDATTGKSYFCFIYSRIKIDIDKAFKKIQKDKGTFEKRVLNYFNNDLMTEYQIELLDESKIEIKSKNNNKNLIVVIVEIDHIGG